MRKKQAALSELDFALALHRIAVSNLPGKTPVDSIPSKFAAMFPHVPFPIPADRIPPGPDGLASILSAGFAHILSFTQNREGRVFATPVFSAETPGDQIVDAHNRVRTPEQSKPSEVVGKPPNEKVKVADVVNSRPDVFAQHKEGVTLLAKGVHELLKLRADIGEATSMDELRKKISDQFFFLYNVPLAVAGGTIPIDPIALIERNQGVYFTRIMEEPVTGGVFVKPIVVAAKPAAQQPAVVQPVQPTVNPFVRQSSVYPLPEDVGVVAAKLRAQVEKSLAVLDRALSGKKRFEIPDNTLWKNALETLSSQEAQALEVLSNLFPS